MSKEQWSKENLAAGEEYAGIIIGKNGDQDYHLILLPGEVERATWNKAMDWAKSGIGQLPTRREQSLLFANLPEHFNSAWYWSCEQLASDAGFAWVQVFVNGNQGNYHKSFEGRARAVRRLPIQ
ncbi:MAG: DUF1566 domain-containing protein [Pseudomonadota bacterium]